MKENTNFDVIIIGGSYSGLSAAMSLGRAIRKVLIIDSGKPCNRQTPHSHNFLTQDGATPAEISKIGKAQVLRYDTVKFYNGFAVAGHQIENGFEIKTEAGDTFTARKLIFATGIKDTMPDIRGFADCWGISIIHCPYCHGYEYKKEKTGIFSNGETAFEMVKLISNWTDDLTVYTNGKSTLTEEQRKIISKKNIALVEDEIDHFKHTNGQLEHIVFKNKSSVSLKALYARVPFTQHSEIPAQMGCEVTEHGLLKIDNFQKTSVHGVAACGDNSIFMRSVANAVQSGAFAGAVTNMELINESF